MTSVVSGATSESAARARLGIPPDAERVLVIGESTHWDPDWMLTSEGYWRWRVERTLDRALDELAADKRRVFGIECVFFLRMYWERKPHRRDEIRSLVAEGRLRMSGSGVTTPDTLLPRTEAVLRDYLVGREWMRDRGLDQEPRVAYFPDSFGHSPALPELLAAIGCDMAAITRIDGMFFPGADWELPRRFPRPGSSAAHLVAERAADFVWTCGSGAEVLCHWNTYGYGMGELLAHRGITRVSGYPLAAPARSDAHVAKRIRSYVAKLEAVSPTPYLFCPVGYDFAAPIRDLCGLLDRFNANHFATTGIWAVCAALEDHLELVGFHRDRLPRVALDPNPYWSGFYSSRPRLKQAAADLVTELLALEALAVAAGDDGCGAALGDAWYTACVANHHDFVTGTSPDRVVRTEQLPWLYEARAAASAALARLAVAVTAPPRPKPVVADVSPAAPRTVSATTWADAGGLWRMGQEFAGGRFDRVASVPLPEPAGEGGGQVEVDVDVGGSSLSAAFGGVDGGWRAHVETTVPPRHTTTFDVSCGHDVEGILMDAPGGVVERPLKRWYEPTYWPLQRWAVLSGGGRRTLILTRYPTALSVDAGGTARVVCGRNATHERAWGWLPIPGMPAAGHEPAVQVCEIAVVEGAGATATRRWHALWPDAGVDPGGRALVDAAGVVVVEDDRVEVLAVKHASRGGGVVVRLMAPFAVGEGVRVRCTFGEIVSACECDVLERDGDPVPVSAGAALVTMHRSIMSVRVDVDRRPAAAS